MGLVGGLDYDGSCRGYLWLTQGFFTILPYPFSISLGCAPRECEFADKNGFGEMCTIVDIM